MRLQDDRGATLVVALLVTSVSAGMCVTAVMTAATALRDAGTDRQRIVAIAAAEAGLDAAMEEIRRSAKVGSENALPCTWPVDGSRANAATHPDVTTVFATIRYRLRATGTYLTCRPNNFDDIDRAEVVSLAETNVVPGSKSKGRRVMRADVTLSRPTPSTGSVMTYLMRSTVIARSRSPTFSTGSTLPRGSTPTATSPAPSTSTSRARSTCTVSPTS